MITVPDKSFRETQTYLMSNSLFFFRRPCRLWDNVEKFGIAGQAIDDNMAHAHYMLDT